MVLFHLTLLRFVVCEKIVSGPLDHVQEKLKRQKNDRLLSLIELEILLRIEAYLLEEKIWQW